MGLKSDPGAMAKVTLAEALSFAGSLENWEDVLNITQEGSGTPEVAQDSSLPGEESLVGESREGCRQGQD